MATRKTSKDSVSSLTRELRQRETELTIINSVQHGLVSKLDIQGIYDLVGDKIREIFDVESVLIFTYDRQANLFRIPYGTEEVRDYDLSKIKDKRFLQYFDETKQTLLINRNLNEEALKYGIYDLDDPAMYDPEAKPGPDNLNGSALFVPLLVGSEVKGFFSLQDSKKENAFSDSDVRLLETLANSMSVALESARLFDETQLLLRETERRNAELAVINSVQQGLAKQLDFKGIVDLIGEKVGEIFRADTTFVSMYDSENDWSFNNYYVDRGQRTHFPDGPTSAYRPNLAATIVDTRSPLLVGTTEESAKLGAQRIASGEEGVDKNESYLGVPILTGDKPIGVIAVQSYKQYAYKQDDLRLLQTLANSMSVALENVRLFDETQRLLKETEQRNAELAIINGVQEGLVTHLDFNSIIHLVGGKLGEIFKVSTIQINIYDRAQNVMHIPYCFEEGNLHTHDDVDLDAPHWFISHMKQIIETKQTVIINENTMEVARQRGGPTEPPKGAKWSLCMVGVPLIAKGEATGVIWLMDNDRENVFSEPMVRLLQTLANSMSVALENARLWEQEKMFRKALQRELDIGREIQTGFLPETLPKVEGWEIAASLMSAREVAGDFYDAFELPDGTLGLVIADVCDKGVGAALFMTLFRSLIRAAANLDSFEQTDHADASHSSADRLQRSISLTNNYIAETHGESGMFATLFFGILDPRNGKLSYINGGHEPPIIVRSGAVHVALHKTGPAVGVITNGHFEILETQMQPGDVFFTFTDGVPDCQNPRGEFYGRERLLESFQQMNKSASVLVADIESDLRQYIASANQFDDITLLAVKRV